jgi:hypothetical protein
VVGLVSPHPQAVLARVLNRLQNEGPLVVFSVAVTSVFLLAFLVLAFVFLLVQREHALAERANQGCSRNAPPGATGWTLDWSSSRDAYTCIYDRNGRRTGKAVRIRRSELSRS